MRFVMSSFSCFRFGSVGFVLRRLFLVWMRSLIGAGSIEFCVFTCPLGMWCLSAVSMSLVRSLFEVCTLSGDAVFDLLESNVCVILIVMRMGRWSEWSAVLVSHCVLLSSLDDIVVISSEVGCCFFLVVCMCGSF